MKLLLNAMGHVILSKMYQAEKRPAAPQQRLGAVRSLAHGPAPLMKSRPPGPHSDRANLNVHGQRCRRGLETHTFESERTAQVLQHPDRGDGTGVCLPRAPSGGSPRQVLMPQGRPRSKAARL